MASTPLHLPQASRDILKPYLPSLNQPGDGKLPFVTLTYAASLDSQIAMAPGLQTALSGVESKSMTHYLRTKHDAILIGVGTAICDDPTLNSRIDSAIDCGLVMQPRPIILDPRARWNFSEDSKVIKAAMSLSGKAPWIFVDTRYSEVPSCVDRDLLKRVGGEYIFCKSTTFEDVLKVLAGKSIKSVMVEGGAKIIEHVINSASTFINTTIITIAPVYLGQGGVKVSPNSDATAPDKPAMRFTNVTWIPLGQDVAMCSTNHEP